MRTLGNILWFLLGGIGSGLIWLIAGGLWCVTIIGIPVGVQCFKFAELAFFPFKKDVVFGGGAGRTLLNILWLLLTGLWMAVGFAAVGCVFCITIIGIPFGMQFFKMAKLALMPFGAEVVPLIY